MIKKEIYIKMVNIQQVSYRDILMEQSSRAGGGICLIKPQDLRVAKVKAAIFDSGNTERFISKAIRTYQDPRLDEVPKGEVVVRIGYNNEKEILVTNVPMVEFEGEVYANLDLTATLEEILDNDQEMASLITNNQIDFNKLLI